MSREKDPPYTGIKVFLYTLPVYLSEVSDLLGALNILTYFLYGIMLLIILVSAAVTYRLILHERTREIGIMRAIGFYGGDLRQVLWTEVLFLGIISLVSGFAAAGFFGWAISFMSFSWFPGFEIFMTNGRLTALYVPGTMLINIVSVFLALFAAAMVPAFRSSRKHLSALLTGDPL
jgi:ABC-type antimicrobial peptide transport system permease subunit